jgi:hypothetical protein
MTEPRNQTLATPGRTPVGHNPGVDPRKRSPYLHPVSYRPAYRREPRCLDNRRDTGFNYTDAIFEGFMTSTQTMALVRQRAEGVVSWGAIPDRAVMKQFYPEAAMKIAEGNAPTASGRRGKVSYVPSESEDIDLK